MDIDARAFMLRNSAMLVLLFVAVYLVLIVLKHHVSSHRRLVVANWLHFEMLGNKLHNENRHVPLAIVGQQRASR